MVGASGTSGDGAFADAFGGRRVLVTGHTGFKGSWLTMWLRRLGAEVVGYSLPAPTTPSNYELSQVRDLLVREHVADVRDRERLAGVVAQERPEVIFHLAAQSLVPEGYAQPFETFAVNVMGVVGLLEAVRLAGRPCVVVVVTSDKCYANLEHDRGYRESDPMAGRDPYSASKGMAELATAAYREAFFPADESANHGVRVASARAGNVIGGGDWSADRLLPDVIAALAEDCAPELRHPEAVRPWQHVLEPLSGYLTLAGRMLTSADPEWPSAWNFGPRREDSVAVGEVTDMALQAWGAGEWRRRPSEGDPHEASLLYLDIEKSTTVLGWRPRWPVREAVERAVAWYRAYYVQRPASMRARCESDIAANEAAMTEETRG